MSDIVFVTGGTGLLGNNVIRQLVKQGSTVRALVRSPDTPISLAGLEVELIRGDLLDQEALQKGCAGAARVIHCAGSVAIGWAKEPMYSVNVTGTQHVIAAASSNNCRLVHVSSVNALAVASDRNQLATEDTALTGDEVPCNYVLTKRDADELIRKHQREGLDAVIVYPGFMLGPYDWKPSSGRMFQVVGYRFTPIAPSGGCSVCDVRDVAEAIVVASHQSPRREYILAGHNISYFDLWEGMAKVAGSRPPRFRMGPVLRWFLAKIGDAASQVTSGDTELNSAMIAMSAQSHYYSSLRAEEDLGYKLRDIRHILTDAWEWLDSRRK